MRMWKFPLFFNYSKVLRTNKCNHFHIFIFTHYHIRLVGKDGFEPPNSEEDRFTVCCRWPLGYLPLKNQIVKNYIQYLSLSHLSESNQRPTDYKSVALPAELKWHFLTETQCCKELSNKNIWPLIFWEGKGNGIIEMQKFIKKKFLQMIEKEWSENGVKNKKTPFGVSLLCGLHLFIFFSFYLFYDRI